MTRYVIREAADWGMRWARPPVRQVMPVSMQYVHHSAGNPLHHLTADEAFRFMNEMAIREGMSAIDYSVLVHEHPATDTVTLGIARGEFLPAATYHSNEVSKAVCALGYFHPDGHPLAAKPSTRMIHGVALALALCVQRGWNLPTSGVRGHRQNPYSVGSHATACPGDDMMPHIPRIVELRNAHLSTPTPTPTPTPGPDPAPVPPITEETDMIPAVGKCTDGAYLAQFEFRGPVFKIGDTAQHDVRMTEVFGRGGGRVFDVVEQRIYVAGSWSATERVTQAQLIAKLRPS